MCGGLKVARLKSCQVRGVRVPPLLLAQSVHAQQGRPERRPPLWVGLLEQKTDEVQTPKGDGINDMDDMEVSRRKKFLLAWMHIIFSPKYVL